MPAVKLYLPYGNLKGFTRHTAVTLHWFRKDRTEPVAPYETLIQSYKQLTAPDQRLRAEQMVNEFFTEAEFHALRDYLQKKQGADLRTGVLVAPVNGVKYDSEGRPGLLRPFARCVDGEGGGFYKLSEEPGYALPFTVWGYYTAPAWRFEQKAAAVAAATPEPAPVAAAG